MGNALSTSAITKSWRKSCRQNCGPIMKQDKATIKEPIPIRIARPELAGCEKKKISVGVSATVTINQTLPLNICPAPMRFFQNNAIAGGPIGESRNGDPLALVGRACRLPERTAEIRSAIRRDRSTDASSKATFARTTQT